MTTIYFKQWDVTLAVQAIRTLRYETHTPDSMAELFWEPTRSELKKLSRSPPKKLLLISGKPFGYPIKSSGKCANVYVASKKKVLHLGTIFDLNAFKAEQRRRVEFYQGFLPSQAELWSKRKPGDIFKDMLFSFLTVPSIGISEKTIVGAVKKYMRLTFPSLAGRPIAWLAIETAYKMNSFIIRQAKLTAKKQTAEEKKEIIKQNLFDF